MADEKARFTLHFNPRARVGRDEIDIGRSAFGSHFNPRARVGRDDAMRGAVAFRQKFQSTRPRGARLSPALCNALLA